MASTTNVILGVATALALWTLIGLPIARAVLPAQTLVPVPKLAIDPMLFEVEAVVVLD